MIAELTAKLRERTDLSYAQMSLAMADILSGSTSEAENADFLARLADKGETDDELLGMLDKMRELSLRVEPRNRGAVIDMCGTGGDGLGTFNVSTAASFVVAASGGAAVAKHGNRSSRSGATGSADIFEYLGCDLYQGPAEAARILERHNICFMFAQKFHPAMRHVSAARRRIGRRTAFNLLGPLSNPAGVKSQLVGVSSADLLDRLPGILRQRGARTVMAVRSGDGMDEFSTSSANRVAILRDDGGVSTDVVDPEAVGLHRSSLGEIRIKTREDAIRSFVGVLNDTACRAMVETTALNAAGGLIVAGIADSFGDATEMALGSIRGGQAYKTLEGFVKDAGDVAKLGEAGGC